MPCLCRTCPVRGDGGLPLGVRAAAPRRSEGMNGAGRGCGGEGRFGSRCGPASARRAARATSSTSATASSSPPPRPRCAAPPHARSDAALSLPLRRRDLCALVSWTSDYGACWNPRLCAVLGLNRPPRVRRMSCGTGRGGAGGGLRGRGQALPLRPRRLTQTRTRTRTGLRVSFKFSEAKVGGMRAG